MKYNYTVTTYSCPHCGTVLKKDDQGWWMILNMMLFPFWIFFGIPFLISWWILKDHVFKVEIPSVGNPFTRCKHCGRQVKNGLKIAYTDLNNKYKKIYDFRWWFRISYILGAVAISSLVFPLLFGAWFSSHQSNIDSAIRFLIVAIFSLIIIFIILYYWHKQTSFPKNTNTVTDTISTNSTSLRDINTNKSYNKQKLIELKELYEEGLITKEEYDKKRKKIISNEDDLTNISPIQVVQDFVDAESQPMQDKEKMLKFTKMFHQSFSNVIHEKSGEINQYKCNFYNFNPLTMFNKIGNFYIMIEVLDSNTRYFTSEFSYDYSFVLCEWVFEDGKKTEHINYGAVVKTQNDLMNHYDNIIKKLEKILKTEENYNKNYSKNIEKQTNLNEHYSNLSEIEKGLKSSGKQFAKKYFNDVKINLETLITDPIFKDNYIRKIFTNEKCDKDIAGTRTRINALIRLAKRHNYQDILKFIK